MTRWRRYGSLAATCVVPWTLPFLTNALTANHENLRLVAVLIWPVVVLMVGVSAATWRLGKVSDTRPAIRAAKLRYTNRLTVALFMLFLFELIQGICLAARGPTVQVTVIATLLFYVQYVVFILRSQHDWRHVQRLDELSRNLPEMVPTRLPRPPRWKREIRAIRFLPDTAVSKAEHSEAGSFPGAPSE